MKWTSKKDNRPGMSIRLFFTKRLFSTNNLVPLAGPLLSGISVFLVLSHLIVPSRITVPSSLIISLVVFGICTYYQHQGITSTRSIQRPGNTENSFYRIKLQSNFFIIVIYILSLIVCAFSTNESSEVFIPREEVNVIEIINMAAAILLSFFMPGYALIVIVDKRNQLQPLPKLLVAFLFSILITGLTTYILGSAGFASTYIKGSLISIGGLILILFAYKSLKFYNSNRPKKLVRSEFLENLSILVKNHFSEIITFSCFFALVFLFTYYLYNGIIISDHWFHFSRALYFVSGSFKDIATSGTDWLYPPFFSAVLAGFFSLSGVPAINAYVSIHFLNLMPVFAFYYFFTKWSPPSVKRASLIASGLFILSSGFGWINVIGTGNISTTLSPIASVYHLQNAGTKTFDVLLPNTFINVSAPDFTTGLIIIGLPAGFVLLGLLKEKISDKMKYIAIISAVSFIGLFSHDEFYLFIIVASIIPAAFKLEGKNNFYAALLIAVTAIILMDIVLPAKYYTIREIFGIPLVLLSILFIVFMWSVYASRILHKIHIPKLGKSPIIGRKFVSINIRFFLTIFVVSLIAYLYVFSFIVWNQFSVDEVIIHTSNNGQRDIPWYLYPMKFGVTGLLGLTFILSYLFKKFEKEIFVFGIIAIVALFAGPYYDEHRFGKYIMVGMVGFASILVYKIILFLQRSTTSTASSILKPLACSILLGVVFTSASLSVFMFIGYRALLLENPIHNPPGRLDFPSASEMQLISFLRNKTKDSETSNIATWANEYNLHYGLESKLESFLGIPRSKILQSPLTLNASSLEGLYKLLGYSHTGNIVLPRYSLSGNGTIRYETALPSHNQNNNDEKYIVEPINFVFDNFQKAYQDDNYTVLKVPSFSAPSSEEGADIGLVYDSNKLSSVSEIINNTNTTTMLQYNHETFTGIKNNTKFVKIQQNGKENRNKNEIGSEILTLYGDKRGRTLWSNSLTARNVDINYIEAKLRFIEVNKTSDFGIRMQDENGYYEYYVSIASHKNSLELKQRSVIQDNVKNRDKNHNKELVLSQNLELSPERDIWYTLKILVLKDTINVYLDDILKIKAPKSPYAENFNSISKIGIRANKNIVQFGSLKTGYVSDSFVKSYEKASMQETYYHHYYPLSALALSKLKFDTFMDGDLSVFSKKIIVLTSDPTLEIKEMRGTEENQKGKLMSEREFNRYLEFAKSGGTLIVIDPHGNDNNNNKSEQTAFSELLSIRYQDKVEFKGISSAGPEDNGPSKFQQGKGKLQQEERQMEKKGDMGKIGQQEQFLNISGVATNIELGNSSDTSVKSYYVSIDHNTNNHKQVVAPFAIEKKYGQGRIIIVNMQGFFDALFQFPQKFFQYLGDIPSLIGLETNDNTTERTEELQNNNKEIPITRFIGHFGAAGRVLINSSSFSLVNAYLDSEHSLVGDIFISNYKNGVENKFKDALIKDLKFIGPYEVSINSNGISRLPSPPSEYDYVAFSVRLPLDINIKLYDGSSAEISVGNSTKHFRSDGGSEIHIRKLRSDQASVDILMRSPQIKVTNGKSIFSQLYSADPMAKQLGEEVAFNEARPGDSGSKTEVMGNLSLKFDYIDHYNHPYKNGTTSKYLSYLKSLEFDGNSMVVQVPVMPSFKIPGDLSEKAKQKGMNIPLERILGSKENIVLLAVIPIAIIIVLKFRRIANSIKHGRILS